MTINDPVKFCANLWDWGILKGCFGDTQIEPTDMDGWVERKGQFLIIETKSPGTKIPTGQRITFESAARTGFITILIIWGKVNEPQSMRAMYKDKITSYPNANLNMLRKFVTLWYEMADKPHPMI